MGSSSLCPRAGEVRPALPSLCRDQPVLPRGPSGGEGRGRIALRALQEARGAPLGRPPQVWGWARGCLRLGVVRHTRKKSLKERGMFLLSLWVVCVLRGHVSSLPTAGSERWHIPGRRGIMGTKDTPKSREKTEPRSAGGTMRSRTGSLLCASSPDQPLFVLRTITLTRRRHCRLPWPCRSPRTEGVCRASRPPSPTRLLLHMDWPAGEARSPSPRQGDPPPPLPSPARVTPTLLRKVEEPVPRGWDRPWAALCVPVGGAETCTRIIYE